MGRIKIRNFYYVVSFNLTNPRVKAMLDKQGITNMSGFMLDFKLRSKLFISYAEAVSGAHEDFEKKLEVIYPDKKTHKIHQIAVANPSIVSQDAEVIESLAQQFGVKYLKSWDENCCSVIFFADVPEEFDIDDEFQFIDANSWMFKYEIMFTEDAIELSGNGDFVFNRANVPYSQFNSTYH